MFAEVNDNTPVSDTEKALRELEAEGETIQGREKPADTKPEGDTKPEEKVEDKKPEDTDSSTDPSKKEEDKAKDDEPKTVPAWKAAMIARKARQEAGKNLDVKNTAEYKQMQQELAQAQEKAERLEREQQELNDKKDDLENSGDNSSAVLREIRSLKDRIDSLTEEKEANEQSAMYNAEFAETVLPLIKKDFPNLSEKSLADMSEKIKRISFSDAFLDTPLVDIYSDYYGALVKEMRPIVKGRATAEVGRGSVERQGYVDFGNLSEDDFERMTPEEVEKYLKYKRQK